MSEKLALAKVKKTYEVVLFPKPNAIINDHPFMRSY